jgi:hypothetical protein
MEQNPPEEERFMTNVLDLTYLVHDLATICWDANIKDINPGLVAIAENYLETYDKLKLIDAFIKHSHKYWTKIYERKEIFFIENAHEIFQYLPIDTKNINAFKIFFTAKDNKGEHIIIQEDRDAIWDIFDSLVKICIKYIHRVRGVKLVKTKDGLRPVYKNKLYPDVNVKKHAKIWTLNFLFQGKMKDNVF